MALVMPKSVFIHVPKTGGTWVRAAIAAAGIRAEESGPFDIHDHYGIFDLPAFLVKDRFTFGFVRHPVDWIKSRWAWGMLSGSGEKIGYEPAAAGHWMASCWSVVFPEFVDGYLRTHPGVASATMLRALGYVKIGPNRFVRSAHAVDFVGQYEWLNQDLIQALQLAGEDFDERALDAAPQRVAARGPLRESCRLSADLYARIVRAETPICALFGYS